MDLTPFFKELAQGGVMGALTLVVFYIARKDYLASKDELLGLYRDVKDDKSILVSLVKETSIGITALTKAVESIDDDKPFIGQDRRNRK